MGRWPVSKSARTTSQDGSLKPSAVPPPTQHLANRLATLVATAAKASRAMPPPLEGLAAAPTARTAHVVQMVLVIATTAPTILTAAHDGGWLTNPPLLTMPRCPLLDLPSPALLSSVAPAPASSSHMAASAAVPAARSPAHGHETATRTDNSDASGVLAPSGAGTGAH